MSIDKKLLKRLKALYVEDDDNIRNELSSLLGNFFDTVYTAANGEEGLALFKEHQNDIDVVLSDINMPKLTGIDMVKEIRKTDAKVPVMFATAYSDNEYLADAIKLRVYDYIIKPIDIRRLLTVMNDLANVLYQEFMIEQQHKELEKYKDVIDKNNIVLKTDTNFKITYVNQHFCDITGYDQEELLGQGFDTLIHKDVNSTVYKDLTKAILNNESWNGKIKNQTKFGDTYVVDSYTIATLSDAGEVTGTISIQKDITSDVNQKRDIQKALIKDKSEIFLKGKESSGELNAIINELNKRIHDLQKLMKASDLEKDRLVYNGEKLITENKKLQRELAYALKNAAVEEDTSSTLKLNKSNQDLKMEIKKLNEEQEALKDEMQRAVLQTKVNLETKIKELEKQNKEYLFQIESAEDVETLTEKLEYWKSKAKEGAKRVEQLERALLNTGDKNIMSRLFK
ncbi:MAG: response regulator [Candidatus Marinarcus sp.]|uniref:response regulator n=1 Tax=Candidatus Marinarcus sp. TaxID=3100987 RepID=UPI003B00A053